MEAPKVAYLVALVDDWSGLRKLQDPFALLPELADQPRAEFRGRAASCITPAPSAATIESAAGRMRNMFANESTSSTASVVERWYVMDVAAVGPASYRVVAVYDHQHAAWQAVIAYLDSLTPDDLHDLHVESLMTRFCAGLRSHSCCRKIWAIYCTTIEPRMAVPDRTVPRSGGDRAALVGAADRRR